MTGWANVDGTVLQTEDASISVRDRGFLYGDAVFETIRIYGGTPFGWWAHLDRLTASAAAIDLTMVPDPTTLWSRVEATLSAAGYDDAYVRLSITRGIQSGRLTPEREVQPTVVVLTEPLPRGGTTGTAVWDEPAVCTVAATRCIPPEALPPSAKTHNYLNGILARLEARDAGADEAILLDTAGRIMEGATCNVFFVNDGTLLTPALENRSVLPGITRATVMTLAKEHGVPVATIDLETDTITNASEVFLTNTTWEVRPVGRIDERIFETGPVTASIATAYREYIETNCYHASPGPLNPRDV